MTTISVAIIALVMSAPALAQTPASSLKGSAATPLATAPRGTQTRQLEIPANLAKIDDAAIIIIGGKPMTAGEVKRQVRALDDNAIIIIGGKPVAAAAMKTELRANAPVRTPGNSNPANYRPLEQSPPTSYSGGTAPSSTADAKRQLDEASAQQRVGSRAASPSTLSPWPQPPGGTKILSAEGGWNTFGIHAIEPSWVYEKQRFVIRGIGLGDKAGEVELSWQDPWLHLMHPIGVTTTRWTSTRIDAETPSPLPFIDNAAHDLELVVKTSTGEKYISWIRVQRL